MPDAIRTSPDFRLVLTPDKAALATDGPTALRVLVRVQAPDVPANTTARPPLHLALVLDRSGSMSGVPLEEAKRCARNMIDSLGEQDRAAIFAFDDQIERIASLTSAVDKLALAAALTGIQSGGTTNLHGGWHAGAEELAEQLAGQEVHRVILLSDGCANAGTTDLEVIAMQCKAFAQRGVTTSTYGLGPEFNEQLMLAMAAAGRGNAYYGQAAADLAEPFATEFALLASLCARGLVLKVNAPDGIGVKVRNDYEAVEGEVHTWRLPDLAFASEAWALLEFEIPPAVDGRPAGSIPITVSVQAALRDSAPLFLMSAFPPLALVTAAQRLAMPDDELVARRALELDAAAALQKVRMAIDADDWDLAQRLVDDAAMRFADHAWATAIMVTMRRLITERDRRLAMKEAAFSARSMSARLSSRDEGMFCMEDEPSVPAFLRRKPEQGKGQRGS